MVFRNFSSAARFSPSRAARYPSNVVGVERVADDANGLGADAVQFAEVRLRYRRELVQA
jgi:hypothetical protein